MAAGTLRFIEAAGGLLWRASSRGPEIAVVHRPQYDDWSLPKGKVDHGEHALLAALREVEEETGFVGRPGRMLGEIRYLKERVPKRVRYWAMQVVSGSFAAGDEVDELAWLSVPETLERLAPARDRPIAQAFAADPRPTTPSLLVRHASAADRATWDGDDRARPLDDRGRRQAAGLVALLTAFGIRRAVAPDLVRCLDTVAPFARACGIAVEIDNVFSETGYLADSPSAEQRMRGFVSAAEPVAVCSQGEVISLLLRGVCAQSGGIAGDADVAKGGFVVLHFDAAEPTTIVAVDSYPPTA
jgi:8-oxo-(d)GTP phosphatase